MSTLRLTTLAKADGSASVPVDTVINGSAKAWCFFNGTAAVITLASQFNVSSITDNGVGIYRVNFTTPMPDVNYAVGLSFQPTVSNAGSDSFPIFWLTGSVEIRHYEANSLRDSNNASAIIYR